MSYIYQTVVALSLLRLCYALGLVDTKSKHTYTGKLQEELEKVQNRAARFVTRNYVYETGSMTGILGQLKWESLKKRRQDNRIVFYTKV